MRGMVPGSAPSAVPDLVPFMDPDFKARVLWIQNHKLIYGYQ